MSLKKWTALHHEVWRILQKNLNEKLKKSPFLICVSGGADSMALLCIMKDLPIKIEVFHAHHGPGNNVKFRDEAQNFVMEFCRKEKILLHKTKARMEMKSESQFRDFRISFLKKWNQKHPEGIIVMGHHSQDLLETRMMRLIRGTGPQGLGSMKIWKAPIFRPFLEIGPNELRKFLKDRKQDWFEDPSNQDTHYFRNWIRHRWLSTLEKTRPGSLKRLAQSLETLSHSGSAPGQITEELSQSEYAMMNQKDQLQSLALLLKNQGLVHFTSGQLKEVQKRLDNPKTRLSFKAAGALWTVNAQRILLKPL